MSTSGALELADIFRLHGAEFRRQNLSRLSGIQLRVLSAIEKCRTAALGGHLWQCDQCGTQKISYNSCRNRHCPKCQGLDKERWLEERRSELLPVPYFHLVFTLPHELNAFAQAHPQWLYDLLFRCASASLLEVAADPKHLGAKIGILAVLHTWSQKLTLHPHLHCIVPGGGLSVDGRWVWSRKRFFLPVRVLARLFRGKVLAALKEAYQAGELDLQGALAAYQDEGTLSRLLSALYAKPWVVYSKPPFGGPERVLAYLARYTHRVAITNQRLVRLEGDHLVFTWKDYAHGNLQREMNHPAREFIRRFLLHVLPHRFVRIRYYGLLANRRRQENLALCRKLLEHKPVPKALLSAEPSWQELLQKITGIDPTLCPACGQGRLHLIQPVPPSRDLQHPARPPP